MMLENHVKLEKQQTEIRWFGNQRTALLLCCPSLPNSGEQIYKTGKILKKNKSRLCFQAMATLLSYSGYTKQNHIELVKLQDS